MNGETSVLARLLDDIQAAGISFEEDGIDTSAIWEERWGQIRKCKGVDDESQLIEEGLLLLED